MHGEMNVNMVIGIFSQKFDKPERMVVSIMKNREPPCPEGCMDVNDERPVCR